ncbi:MAG: UvrB/UvrC motif-containing protein, partial [Lentisphaeria bacterium]|nr:UvrB/UvrC motif-containing protein [Lentisphaeria bacterium]
GYIHYEAPEEEQNFSTLIEFINAMEVREDDEGFQNPIDILFAELEKEMLAAAAELEFERAADLRDRIRKLQAR